MKHITSILFLTNSVHALFRGAFIYSMAFLALTLTSIAFHGTGADVINREQLYWLDQIAIFSVFLVGAYYIAQIPYIYRMLALLSVIIVGAMYYGGYLTESCCFDECVQTATISHCCMHIIGSLGHHCIMAGLS